MQFLIGGFVAHGERHVMWTGDGPPPAAKPPPIRHGIWGICQHSAAKAFRRHCRSRARQYPGPQPRQREEPAIFYNTHAGERHAVKSYGVGQ